MLVKCLELAALGMVSIPMAVGSPDEDLPGARSGKLALPERETGSQDSGTDDLAVQAAVPAASSGGSPNEVRATRSRPEELADYRSVDDLLGSLNSTAPNLSPRELSILKLLRDGEPNKSIARQLVLTESTVKVHLKSILRKIRVKNRTQAAVWAMSHALAAPRAAAE